MKKIIVSTTRRYLMQETILFLVISYLLIFASSHHSLANLNILTITTGLFTIGYIIWLLKKRFPYFNIERPTLIFFGALLITTITSIDPRRSIAEVWLIGVSFYLFFMVAGLVNRGWPAELVIKVVLIIGGIIMILCWVETGQWYFEWLESNPGEWLPSVAYRLPAPNFLCVVLNVWLMTALARLIFTKSLSGRMILCIWAVSAFGLIYLTSSRGGWLGTTAGIGCLGMLSIQVAPVKWFSLWNRIRERRVIMISVVLAGVAVLIGLGWLLSKQVLHPTHAPILSSRMQFWGPAWKAFLRSPIIGMGPHTFISIYLQEYSIPPYKYFDYAHSIMFDLLSGSGIIGLLAFIWIGFEVVRSLWRRLLESRGEERAVVMGAISALAAFGVHGLFDSVHHTAPTSSWNLAIILGAAFGVLATNQKKIGWGSIGIGISVVVLSWINIWFLLPFNAGVQSAEQGDWESAVRSLTIAVERDSNHAIAHQQLGLANSILANKGNSEVLESAIKAFENAVELDPYWALNHANLGVLYQAQGDLEAAYQELLLAIEFAPGSALFHLNHGQVEEALGYLTDAERSYHMALALQPEWAEAYFWRSTDFKKYVLEAWEYLHPKENAPSIRELEMVADSNSGMLKPYLNLVTALLKENRLEEVDRLLKQANMAYSSQNEWRLELQWLKAELHAARGDYKQAIKIGEEVLDQYKVRGIYGPGSLGNPTYALFMFRRPALNIDLVPQMTTIPVTDLWGERMLMLSEWYGKERETKRADEVKEILNMYIPDFKSSSVGN